MPLLPATAALFCCMIAAAALAQSSAPASDRLRDLHGEVRDLHGEVRDLTRRVLGMQVTEQRKEVRIALPADILFDFDKSDIRRSAEPALKQAAELLRRQARGRVEINGHTDAKGTPAYNKKLSEQRAEAVRRWLVEREGLRRIRFVTRGFGATRPVAPNTKPDGSDDPEGRQKNRRVEILFRR